MKFRNITKQNISVFILLLFALPDLINPSDLAVKIKYLPYSLGEILLIGFSIYLFFSRKVIYSKISSIEIGFILYLFALLLNSFISDNVLANISRTIGLGVKVFAAFILVRYLVNNKMTWFFEIALIVVLIYWSYYIINIILNVPDFIEFFKYAELREKQDWMGYKVYNKHYYGIFMFGAITYFTCKFVNSKRLILASSLILYGIVVSIIIQSRAGFIFLSITLLIFFYKKFGFTKWLIVAILMIFAVRFIYNTYIIENVHLSRHFSINKEVQVGSNKGRVDYYNAFKDNISSFILGKGILNPYLMHRLKDGSYVPKLMHNQYATFIVTGGILAIFLVFAIWINLIKSIIKIDKWASNNTYIPLFYLTVIILLSIFTMETFSFLIIMSYGLLNELSFRIFNNIHN